MDDNIRFMTIAQNPTIGTASRSIRLKMAASSIGVLTGDDLLQFATTSSSTNNITLEKTATLLSQTVVRTLPNGAIASSASSATAQVELTIPTIADDTYAGIVVTPSADTSWLMYAASVFVEFAR